MVRGTLFHAFLSLACYAQTFAVRPLLFRMGKKPSELRSAL
jgi:hypothetical protein